MGEPRTDTVAHTDRALRGAALAIGGFNLVALAFARHSVAAPAIFSVVGPTAGATTCAISALALFDTYLRGRSPGRLILALLYALHAVIGLALVWQELSVPVSAGRPDLDLVAWWRYGAAAGITLYALSFAKSRYTIPIAAVISALGAANAFALLPLTARLFWFGNLEAMASLLALVLLVRRKEKDGVERWLMVVLGTIIASNALEIAGGAVGTTGFVVARVDDIVESFVFVVAVFHESFGFRREVRAAKNALMRDETHLATLVEQIPAIVWTADRNLVLTSHRGAMRSRLPRAVHDAVGLPVARIFGGANGEAIAAHQSALLGSSVPFETAVGGRTLAGFVKPLHGPSGKIDGVVGVALDVSEQRRAEAALHAATTYDLQSRLPFFEAIRSHIEEVLAGGSSSHPVAVIVFDIADAGAIAETLGSQRGARLTAMASARATSILRAGDLLVTDRRRRYVLVAALEDELEAPLLALRIVEAFSAPFSVEGSDVFAPVKAGFCCIPRDGSTADDAITAAGLAFDEAALPNTPLVAFTPDLQDAATSRLRKTAELRAAIDAGELRAYYQPIVSCNDGTIVGAEALVRWQHPRRGLIMPGEFIPLAESSGLIAAIGEFMLRDASERLADWTRTFPAFFASVNLAADQCRSDAIVTRVAGILSEGRFAPAALHLEITESSLMHDVSAASDVLGKLAHLGVGLSIDDFGTGYSSLGYLKHFPVDTLKVDRSFVRDSTSQHDAAIIGAVTSLARGLGLYTIAEGVETPQQLARVRELGVDAYQGYLCSPAVEPDAFAALLHQRAERRELSSRR